MLKFERVGRQSYESKKSARAAIFEYIEFLITAGACTRAIEHR